MTRPRRPDPPPLRTDDRLIAAVGAVAWTIALVVLLVVGLPEDERWWLWVCAVGAGIGVFGYWYLPRLERGRAAAVERRAAKDARRQPLPAETPTPPETPAPAPETPETRPPA